MSHLAKVTKAESEAYAASVTATSELVLRVMAGIDDDVTARLRRRAQAYRIQWLAAARKLEDATVSADSERVW